MGWVNSYSIPGITDNAFLNSSANSSLLFAFVHSLRGCSFIIISISSIDIGSVGTSTAPIRHTIWSTSSGNSFIRIFSIFVVISIVFDNEVPVLSTGCITKSPSSSVGTNSPPIFEKVIPVIISESNANPNTFLLLLYDHFITGS